MKLFTFFLLVLAGLTLPSWIAHAEEEADVLTSSEEDVVTETVDNTDEPTGAPVEVVDSVEADEPSAAEDAQVDDELEIITEEEPVEVPEEETVTDAEADNATTATTAEASITEKETAASPVQSGPFIDLLGETLLSLEAVDEKTKQFKQHYTNEILEGKNVIGLYFSADWCGPCRKFTPELVKFYDKINTRRGRRKDFEIVWISRCRDVPSYEQYFTHMNWLAMPPNEAMGQRGEKLSKKYKVKGIPSLVLLDEVGNVITTDARNKIPMDRAGVGFPWRNPLATLYMTLLPRSLRFMIKSQILDAKTKLLAKLKAMLPNRGAQPVTA